MSKTMLDTLKIGEEGYIKSIFLDEKTKRRLQDMGFIEGSFIKCTLESPLKEPKAYFIKGTIIALRKEITQNILVERI